MKCFSQFNIFFLEECFCSGLVFGERRVRRGPGCAPRAPKQKGASPLTPQSNSMDSEIGERTPFTKYIKIIVEMEIAQTWLW